MGIKKDKTGIKQNWTLKTTGNINYKVESVSNSNEINGINGVQLVKNYTKKERKYNKNKADK